MERYTLLEDCVICEGKLHRTYGIAVMPSEECTLHEFHDVSTDRIAMERLVEQCNALGLAPIHLKDVIDDFLISLP